MIASTLGPSHENFQVHLKTTKISRLTIDCIYQVFKIDIDRELVMTSFISSKFWEPSTIVSIYKMVIGNALVDICHFKANTMIQKKSEFLFYYFI